MRIALIASFASILGLAACGDDGGTAPIDAPSSVVKVSCGGATLAGTVTSSNGAFVYTPATTTISVGQIVKFSMSSEHTATSDTGLFRADFGGDACFRFDAAGTFAFHCEPHLFVGSVVVQ